MNNHPLPANIIKSSQNIWENYDPKQVRIALKKSAGILKGLERTTILKDLTKNRKQTSIGRSF